ncbi:unnamed protein product [Periconia digitata]|uniref:Heterokaryon incompatibility domain-containing protein n=1 Tax=Periconia digitata TaxID=1303443 RepID=A0A9W4US45_9PLEO|nr:unnamed protein product [Periconia digitata]
MEETTPYKPLHPGSNSRCIRVLDVKAATKPDALDEPIQGEFRIIDFDTDRSPSFSALSYVWGSPGSKSCSVLCGGHSLPILPNGHSALRHLRKKLGNFSIWIDAICINQEDIKEKEHQIPLIGDIYLKSNTVYVWLGEGNAQTSRAIAHFRTPKFLEYCYRDGSGEITRHAKLRSWLATFVYEFELCKATGSLYPASHQRQRLRSSQTRETKVTFEDIDSLLDVEWIRRMWTFQEILLASNPILVCGDDHIDWLTFTFGIAFLEYSGVVYTNFAPKVASLGPWIKISLGREYIQSKITGCATTPLRTYIMFIHSIMMNDMKIKERSRLIFKMSSCCIIYVLAIGGGIIVDDYKNTRERLRLAEYYKKALISMLGKAASSQLSPTSTTPANGEYSESASISSLHSTTTVQLTETYQPTGILAILDEVRQGKQPDPTGYVNSAIDKIRTAVESVASDCRSRCFSHTDTRGCFGSCTATNTAMPTVRSVTFQDANGRYRHSPRWFHNMLIIGILLFSCLVLSILIYYVTSRWHRKYKMNYTYRPPIDTVDLIDGIATRQAKLNHDKAFALRSVLQRLSATELSHPDYGRSIEAVYEEFNRDLIRTRGCDQMLAIASFNHLSGYPSWMPDWSKQMEPFWLADGSTKVIADLFQPEQTLSSVGLGASNSLILSALRVHTTPHVYEFQETNRSYKNQQNDLHNRNLATSLKLARRAFPADEKSREGKRDFRRVAESITAICCESAPELDENHIRDWVMFLCKNRTKKCHEVFPLLAADPDLVHTQVTICNSLAKNQRKLFWICSTCQPRFNSSLQALKHNFMPTQGFNYCAGICPSTVQKGHVLLLAPKISIPFFVDVVQSSDPDQNNGAVLVSRLVGPARVRGWMDDVEWKGTFGDFQTTNVVTLQLV